MMNKILIGALMVLAAGCNPRDANNLSEDTKNLAQHAGAAVGSATLAVKVNTALSLRKDVDMNGLHVDAQDGAVMISGHVKDAEAKTRIWQTVMNTKGVDKVDDSKLNIETK